MSLQHSPGIVTNGLSFYYDMYNNEKSWKGEPVTNQFICPNPYDSNNNVSFNVNGTGTFQRVYSGTYGGYTIKPTDVVYRYNLGGNGCHYHGNSAAIASGQYVCYSVDYYISPDASDYPTDSTLVVLENYGGSALGGGTGAGGNGIMGKWQTIRGYSGPTSGSGTQAMFLYPGGCGNSYMASRGFILMKNPMFEFRGDVRYNRFVNGTRSNTQTVLDLTGQNTITANSLTYNNDGTFSFNGSSGNITSSSFIGHQSSSGTIIGWAYPTSTSGDLYFVAVGGTTTYGASRAIRINSGSWCAVNYGSSTEDWNGIVAANVNTWQHVAYAWGGTTIRFYLNGTEYTNTRSGMITPLGSVLTVGATAWSPVYGYWPGRISTMQVYNKALSANEVAQNFAAQRGLYGI